MIEAVIFDQGNVRCSSANEAIKADISKTLHVDPAVVDELWTELVPKKLGTGEINEKEFWRLFYQKTSTNIPLPQGESLLVREMRRLHKVIPGVMEIGDEITKKGIKTAIVSNTIVPHAKLEKSLGHYKDVPVVVLSCDSDVMVRKPDAKIYTIALERLDASPEETVMVDDDENYKQGVLSLGMHWITFQNAGQLRKDLARLGV